MSDRIVTTDIPFGQSGGVYAYRVGDRVSEDAVKENGWEAYVATPSSKAAVAALEQATGTGRPSGTTTTQGS